VLEFSFGDATLDPAAICALLASAPLRRLHTLHAEMDPLDVPPHYAAEVAGDCFVVLIKLVQAAPALKTLRLSNALRLDSQGQVMGSHPGLERLVLSCYRFGSGVQVSKTKELAANLRLLLAPTVDVGVDMVDSNFGCAEVWGGLRMPCW
jgi:hypothetical protein